MVTNWEDIEQERLTNWAASQESQLPQLVYFYSNPNGGKRPPKTAAKMKRTGQKKGIPDVTLAYPVNPWHGLYIELKAIYPDGSTGKVSKDQEEWLDRLAAVDYRVSVCYGWRHAAQTILGYLNIDVDDWGKYLQEEF